MIRRALPVAALALALVAAPAWGNPLGPDAPHSPNAEDIRIAYWVMLVVAALLAAVVLGALGLALARFGERRGAQPQRLTAARGQVGRVVAALSALAAVIFVFGVVVTESARELEPSGPDGLSAAASRYAQVGVSGIPQPAPGSEEPPEGAPLEINVVAQQWLWRFEYPGEREDIAELFTYNELVVPVDTAVVLNITSTDVNHRWFVSALGGQVDAIPGAVTRTWFKADEVGRYPGQSTMFSGSGYPAMRAWVRVVSAAEYEAFIERLGQDLTEAQSAVEDANREAAGGIEQ